MSCASLSESFSPTLNRLVSIRIGLPFRVASIHASMRAVDRDPVPAVAEIHTVDTKRLMRACIDIPEEVIQFAFGDVWMLAEKELRYTAANLVSHLMAESRKASATSSAAKQ